MLKLLLPLLLCAPVALASEGLEPMASLPEGTWYQRGDLVRWSPDGTRVAFVAKLDEGGQLVPMWTGEDGFEVGDDWEFIGAPVFSDDSQHLAFAVGKQATAKTQRWSILLDGKKQGKQDWIGALRFWPGTDKLIYWTQPGAKLNNEGTYSGGSYVLRIDKKKGKKYRGRSSLTQLSFSADGSTAGALVPAGTGWEVLIATLKKQSIVTRSASYCKDLALSADGETWALSELIVEMGTGKGGFGPNAPLTSWSILRGEQRLGEAFEFADQPTFAPTGARLAYRAGTRAGMGVVIEGASPTGLVHDFVESIVWETPTEALAAGDEGLAFVAISSDDEQPDGPVSVRMLVRPTGGKAQVVCLDAAGQPLPAGPLFDEIRGLVIAPGGVTQRNLAYAAQEGLEWFLVHETLDEAGELQVTKSEAFDWISAIRWTPDGFRAGAVRGRDLFWVPVP